MAISEIVGFGAFVLAYGYIIARYLPPRHYVLTNLLTAAGSLLYALTVGASWSDLGLAPSRWLSGLLVGLLISVPILLIIIGVASIPVFRGLFTHEPARHSSSRMTLFELTVRIPFGTALSEEVLFRSVLLGLLLSVYSNDVAVPVSAILFGLWHVMPTLENLRRNDSFNEFIKEQRHRRIASFLLTIFITILAGVGFGCLRLWTGSVVTPWIVHTCINSVAVLSGFVVLKINGK